MKIEVLKSKLHRATVTDANLEYEGSISICPNLLKESQMFPYEKVDILNINNGARFSTYIITGEIGEICLNGAAARHVQRGDRVIIISYGTIDQSEIQSHHPLSILLDENNKIIGGCK